MRTTCSPPPAQVPEPRVWNAPQGNRQTAELGREGRPRRGDPDRWLQGLQGRHRAGGILAARGRDGECNRLRTEVWALSGSPELFCKVCPPLPSERPRVHTVGNTFEHISTAEVWVLRLTLEVPNLQGQHELLFSFCWLLFWFIRWLVCLASEQQSKPQMFILLQRTAAATEFPVHQDQAVSTQRPSCLLAATVSNMAAAQWWRMMKSQRGEEGKV